VRTTGWHRNHARKALGQALRPTVVRPRAVRPPTYGPEVVVALRFCWAVLGGPTGKRLAPVLPDLVARLRRFEELEVSDATATLLVAMSSATIDRRLAPARAAMALRGRSHTKPGSLLKDAIAIRTWAQWDDAVPGFVEIDLVGHEGGNAVGVRDRDLERTLPGALATGALLYQRVSCSGSGSACLRGGKRLVLLVFVEPRRVADADQQAIGAEQPGDHLGPWLGLGLVDELQASLL
jgi:hypothetical protein